MYKNEAANTVINSKLIAENLDNLIRQLGAGGMLRSSIEYTIFLHIGSRILFELGLNDFDIVISHMKACALESNGIKPVLTAY